MWLKDFWRREDGTSLTEYVVMVGGIAVAGLVAVNGFSDSVAEEWDGISSSMVWSTPAVEAPGIDGTVADSWDQDETPDGNGNGNSDDDEDRGRDSAASDPSYVPGFTKTNEIFRFDFTGNGKKVKAIYRPDGGDWERDRIWGGDAWSVDGARVYEGNPRSGTVYIDPDGDGIYNIYERVDDDDDDD